MAKLLKCSACWPETALNDTMMVERVFGEFFLVFSIDLCLHNDTSAISLLLAKLMKVEVHLATNSSDSYLKSIIATSINNNQKVFTPPGVSSHLGKNKGLKKVQEMSG